MTAVPEGVTQLLADWSAGDHAALEQMRNILIDHARGYHYAKRGAGAQKIALDETAVFTEQRAAEFVALDDALDTLAALDARRCKIVELRFFGGLSIEETAEVLKISSPTVQREWRAAKAWLSRFISNKESSENT